MPFCIPKPLIQGDAKQPLWKKVEKDGFFLLQERRMPGVPQDARILLHTVPDRPIVATGDSLDKIATEWRILHSLAPLLVALPSKDAVVQLGLFVTAPFSSQPDLDTGLNISRFDLRARSVLDAKSFSVLTLPEASSQPPPARPAFTH